MQKLRESTGSYQIQNFKINGEEIRNGLSIEYTKSSHKIIQIHKKKGKDALINIHAHQHKCAPVEHKSYDRIRPRQSGVVRIFNSLPLRGKTET